jgi:four helix bundle protein
MAERLDSEMASQLRRAALSINLNIAEGTGRFDRDQRKFLVTARGSALECAAVLDAMTALGINPPELGDADVLLVRIVSMLTRMIG